VAATGSSRGIGASRVASAPRPAARSPA